MSKAQRRVTFEEPPPPRNQRYDWSAIADQLRERPGEWAKVYDNDRTSLANAIRTDSVTPLRSTKGFEVRTTNNRRGMPRTCTLYLRYVPEKDRENT